MATRQEIINGFVQSSDVNRRIADAQTNNANWGRGLMVMMHLAHLEMLLKIVS